MIEQDNIFDFNKIVIELKEEFLLQNFKEVIRGIQKYENSELNLVDPIIYQLLGTAYFKLSQFQHALLNYNKASELVPTNTDYRNNAAVCYLKLGKIKEAQNILQNIIQKVRDPAYYHSLRLIAQKSNNEDKMIEYAKKQSEYYDYNNQKDEDNLVLSFLKDPSQTVGFACKTQVLFWRTLEQIIQIAKKKQRQNWIQNFNSQIVISNRYHVQTPILRDIYNNLKVLQDKKGFIIDQTIKDIAMMLQLYLQNRKQIDSLTNGLEKIKDKVMKQFTEVFINILEGIKKSRKNKELIAQINKNYQEEFRRTKQFIFQARKKEGTPKPDKQIQHNVYQRQKESLINDKLAKYRKINVKRVEKMIQNEGQIIFGDKRNKEQQRLCQIRNKQSDYFKERQQLLGRQQYPMWELQINFNGLAIKVCRINQQKEKTISYLKSVKFSKYLQLLTSQNLYIDKFFKSLVLTCVLFNVYSDQSLRRYVQFNKQTQITFEDMLNKLCPILSLLAQDNLQSVISLEILNTIITIKQILFPKQQINLEYIQNAAKIIAENPDNVCNLFKEIQQDQKIKEKILCINENKNFEGKHQWFRGHLFKDQKFDKKTQNLIQNVAIMWMHAATNVQNEVNDEDLIDTTINEVFEETKNQKSEKQNIIEKCWSQCNKGIFGKGIDLLKKLF